MYSSDSRYTKLGTNADSRSDWLKERANKESVKAIARKTGLSEVAVKDIRSGRSKPRFDTLLAWCQNDEEFREDLIAYLRSDPWTAAGATRPHNHETSYGDPNVDGPLPGSVEETEALMHTFGDHS